MGRLKDRYRKGYQPQEQDVYYPPEQLPEQQHAPPNYHQQHEQEKREANDSPLSILDEIKARRIPKGTFPVMIQGIPIDLHVLEDYIIRISPYNIKTLMRYHNARTLEEIKGYSRFGGVKLNTKMILTILLAIGMAVAGIFFIMFMPKILQSFQLGI